MTGYYLDTSTLVKRYVDEAGSVWLRGLFELEPRPLFVTSHLMIAEMTSAFICFPQTIKCWPPQAQKA